VTAYDTYGTDVHSTSELVRLVTDLLEANFTERESDYRGVYRLTSGGFGRIEIQPNPIPRETAEYCFGTSPQTHFHDGSSSSQSAPDHCSGHLFRCRHSELPPLKLVAETATAGVVLCRRP